MRKCKCNNLEGSRWHVIRCARCIAVRTAREWHGHLPCDDNSELETEVLAAGSRVIFRFSILNWTRGVSVVMPSIDGTGH